MEKRTFWPFSVKHFPQDMNVPIEATEVDPKVMKSVYENRFYGKPKEDPLAHLKKFDERPLYKPDDGRLARATLPYQSC